MGCFIIPQPYRIEGVEEESSRGCNRLYKMLHLPSFRPTCSMTDKGDFIIMASTEPIRDKKQLRQLADYFLQKQQLRNYVLVVLGACTALRISDLLRLRWDDVYDSVHGQFRSRITVVEQKTGKTKMIALNPQAVRALQLYYPRRRGCYIFESNRKEDKAISRIQAWRIIHTAVVAIGIVGKIACHSLRKSWGYHAWTSDGVSPVVIMDVLNHSNYETTRRYLGVAQDDLDRAYLGMGLF